MDTTEGGEVPGDIQMAEEAGTPTASPGTPRELPRGVETQTELTLVAGAAAPEPIAMPVPKFTESALGGGPRVAAGDGSRGGVAAAPGSQPTPDVGGGVDAPAAPGSQVVDPSLASPPEGRARGRHPSSLRRPATSAISLRAGGPRVAGGRGAEGRKAKGDSVGKTPMKIGKQGIAANILDALYAAHAAAAVTAAKAGADYGGSGVAAGKSAYAELGKGDVGGDKPAGFIHCDVDIVSGIPYDSLDRGAKSYDEWLTEAYKKMIDSNLDDHDPEWDVAKPVKPTVFSGAGVLWAEGNHVGKLKPNEKYVIMDPEDISGMKASADHGEDCPRKKGTGGPEWAKN